MAERVLSTRELNRALLARQLLLARSKLPLTSALEQVGGLQTQYAPSAYIALWSRLHGFQRGALTQALEQRRVVQATLMRATIHIVSARDSPLLAAASRRGRREVAPSPGQTAQRHRYGGSRRPHAAAPLRRATPPQRTHRTAQGRGIPADCRGERGDVVGPGAGPALRDLGAAARGPLRTRRRLARQVESDGSPGARAPGAPVPWRGRARLTERPFELGGTAGDNASARGRAVAPAQVPRRAGRRTPRPAASPLTRP